jgi:Skp family chaperone for outer membrane proteins
MFVLKGKSVVALISSILVVSIFVLIFTVFFQNGEERQEIHPITRIAVIDSARLKAEALCFKSHDKLEDMLSDLISKMHDSEIKAKSEYEKTKNDKSLGKKQISKKIEQIEENWNKTSQEYKKEVEKIKKMNVNLANILQKNLDKVIVSVAKKYKIDVVFNSQIRDTISVFYATENVDITDIVIKNLNQIIPNVDMEKLK